MLDKSATPAEGAFRALITAIGLVQRVMQPYFARFGVSGSQWGILRTLHRAEGEGHDALRLVELSERLLIRPPSVTGAVDRLERAGWLRRIGDPTDSRAKQVSLTAEGRKLVQRVLVGHQAQFERVMAGLTAAEQKELQRLLGKLGGHLETLAAGPATTSSSKRG